MLLCSHPKAQYEAHRRKIDEAIKRVLDSGWYILGNEVKAFEAEFAAYIGTTEAVSVASGTDAIALGLAALGIGAGDEVITVSHTAVATVAAIELSGATPVFVDIDPATFTLDPSGIEAAITPKTAAIVAVHLYGQPVDMDAVMAVAARHGLKVVEDCAQAAGAFHKGRRVGAVGDIGCFSFFPTKNLGCIGDGGAITSNDARVAEKVRALRLYGWGKERVSAIPGRNSRLDEIQAAILRVKLPHLDADNERRAQLAAAYGKALEGVVTVPAARVDCRHVYHIYVVRSDRRDELVAHLRNLGVSAMVHYDPAVHQQPAYAGRIKHGPLPETEQAVREILTLPMYPELDDADQAVVIENTLSFFA